MKKSKIKLSDLKVSSFVTEEKKTKGGTILVTYVGCNTFNCPILTADGCNNSWVDACPSAMYDCGTINCPIDTIDCPRQTWVC
ncbi:pinensin family lanthipeptide [Roseivirga sp. BDSF3-8]|uniref:pinensin family lanthipeptide n=1 Tax=Roseivirga sp. BDSF3-8 TaxID=3241598 RepID=UPI0035318236